MIKIGKGLNNNNDNKAEQHDEIECEMEKMLVEHIEANLIQIDSTMKIDYSYFNENYVKQATEKLTFAYSVNCLHTLFKYMSMFESQSLSCKDPEVTLPNDKIVISEKMACYFGINKFKETKTPKNIVDYFIESHIAKILQQLYSDVGELNNYEVENHFCFSLFLIKKLIKDYSFYFDKKPELERIFTSMKKYKE